MKISPTYVNRQVEKIDPATPQPPLRVVLEFSASPRSCYPRVLIQAASYEAQLEAEQYIDARLWW